MFNKTTVINKLKSLSKRQRMITLGVIAAVILAAGLSWFFVHRYNIKNPKQIYSVAVVVRDQVNSDPAEDIRTSMKAGDVLVVSRADHSFSQTELVSYLILKMNLTAAQAAKLTEQDQREIDEDELSAEEQQRIEEEKKRAKDEGREYREMPRRETLRPRLYRIDLEKIGFSDPMALLSGQPFLDKVFDWSVVSKKEKVK